MKNKLVKYAVYGILIAVGGFFAVPTQVMAPVASAISAGVADEVTSSD